MPVIETSGLSKNYGQKPVLEGVDLEVRDGEMLGLIGPNGAGKSTTVRILLGLVRRSGGDARIFGRDVWADAAAIHRRLAYVPEEVKLWPNLTGGEVIDLFGGLRDSLHPGRRAELVDAFDLDPTRKCGAYSRCDLRKVALISALASDVDLYILDEPTAGLDPMATAAFEEYMTGLREAGKTILMSSHILADVERLCDRVSIIRKGRTVESVPVGDLTRREEQILELVAQGLSNSEIADRLFLSVNTVKWHTYNVFQKLNAGNRTQAVARARDLGLLDR